jgi:hypothetical protein
VYKKLILFSEQRANRSFSNITATNCDSNSTATVNITFAPTNINKISYFGFFDLKEDILGDLTLAFETNRCSLDLKTCEKYSQRNFNGLCDILQDENSYFASFFQSLSPQLKCHPLKAGVYTAPNSTIDLQIFTYLPIDGYFWIIQLKLVEQRKNSASKKLIMCINAESKVVKTRKGA